MTHIPTVAIIGGGPGGLFTAYRLRQRCKAPLKITIYESGSRLGGKVLTGRFGSAPITYEAGAAELYDYSHVGEDPLRELVDAMGLKVQPMNGASIVLDERILAGPDDVARAHGEATREALREFDERAKAWMSPRAFYDSDWAEDGSDPLAGRTFEDELALIPDSAARRLLAAMVHSDVATEPHHTSASYGLQNYLMNDPRYMSLYTIEGGIEQLPRALESRIDAEVLLRERVVRVVRTDDQRLSVSSRRHGERPGQPARVRAYDFVVVALPNNYLPLIEWQGASLAVAIHRHHMHYDHPAHYLRVSILFEDIFWRDVLKDSYVMLDAFGGCCLYDESARNGAKSHGVLGWLLAGEAAVTVANLTDEEIIERVLASLPRRLQHGKGLFVEGRVHRWLGAVNGMPGGASVRDMETRHIPEPAQPNLLMVGDYLFDSTLNGVLDSADYVAEWLAEHMEADQYASASVL